MGRHGRINFRFFTSVWRYVYHIPFFFDVREKEKSRVTLFDSSPRFSFYSVLFFPSYSRSLYTYIFIYRYTEKLWYKLTYRLQSRLAWRWYRLLWSHDFRDTTQLWQLASRSWLCIPDSLTRRHSAQFCSGSGSCWFQPFVVVL